MEDIPQRLTHTRVEALDEILGQQFNVLDDGFVRVIDYMGSDTSIVQAARVSYGEGTKKVHEDRGLIRYLMRHQHRKPTISGLSDKKWVAVETVIEEKLVRQIIPQLKEAGAEGIIEYALNKLIQ